MTHRHGHDAGEEVEIASSRLVVEILHVPFDDHQRLVVEREDGRIGVLPAHRDQLVAGGSRVGARDVVGWGQRCHAGSGKREAGSGKREAGSGKREAGSAKTVMRKGVWCNPKLPIGVVLSRLVRDYS